MALVELRPNLIERLTKEADRRRKSVEELSMNGWKINSGKIGIAKFLKRQINTKSSTPNC